MRHCQGGALKYVIVEYGERTSNINFVAVCCWSSYPVSPVAVRTSWISLKVPLPVHTRSCSSTIDYI